jgi:hypothetical protein
MNRAMMVLVLVGCGGVDEESFREEFVQKSCEASMTCAEEAEGSASVSFESQEDCEAFLGGFMGPVVEGCDYDAAAAGDCLSEADKAECSDYEGGGRPKACDAVYTGDGCEW